jgi:hypothetical protein
MKGPFRIMNEPTHLSRFAEWEQIKTRCMHVTDALHEPIDPDIFELVVALNAWGIPTCASCAGHLDHGTGAPYVDIEAAREDGDTETERQAHQALFIAQEAAERGQLSSEEIAHLYQIATEIQRRLGYKHLLVRARITEWLTRFYAQRHVPYNQHLVIQGEVLQGIGCPMRLESQGAGLQALTEPEIHAQNLQMYLEEMQTFAVFLKEEFFRS